MVSYTALSFFEAPLQIKYVTNYRCVGISTKFRYFLNTIDKCKQDYLEE